MDGGVLTGIWLTSEAAAPMRRGGSAQLLAGRGLGGDRYALGGGAGAQDPDPEKQPTLIDAPGGAAGAAEGGGGGRPPPEKKPPPPRPPPPPRRGGGRGAPGGAPAPVVLP